MIAVDLNMSPAKAGYASKCEFDCTFRRNRG